MIWNDFCKEFCKKFWKQIVLGTSDAWMVVRLDKQTSQPAYYIINGRILRADCPNTYTVPGGAVGNQFFEMDGCFWYVTVVSIPSLTGPSVLGA